MFQEMKNINPIIGKILIISNTVNKHKKFLRNILVCR